MMDYDVLNPPLDQIATLPQKMQWFARLQKAKRENEDMADQIKARIEALEPGLLEEMGLHGIEKQTVEGFTLFPQTDIIVSKKAEKDGVTTEVLCEALRNCGLSYMTGETYSASSLKAKVKEWKAEGIDVPDALADKLNIIEKTRLMARKA